MRFYTHGGFFHQIVKDQARIDINTNLHKCQEMLSVQQNVGFCIELVRSLLVLRCLPRIGQMTLACAEHVQHPTGGSPVTNPMGGDG